MIAAGYSASENATGRSRECRPGGLVTAAASTAALAFALLSGCAVGPEPLTPLQTAERIESDRAWMEANQPPLDGPLTLHGAMARALLHNLDARVRTMEQDLSLKQVELARLGLLPRATGRYGPRTRSNRQASSSRPILMNGVELPRSRNASTSNDRSRRLGNLTMVWNLLDFGVSYHAAKQHADRALIAHERRRKAVQEIVQQVRGAWWRAVAAERAASAMDALEARARAALEERARMGAAQVRSPLDALRYRRAMLGTLHELDRQRYEGRRAKLELGTLIGLAPGTGFRLAMPGRERPEPPSLPFGAAELEVRALSYRPELREEQLNARIASVETKKALLRMLPGLEIEAEARYDSNSYLVNNDWASLGTRVAWNLTEIFRAPAAVDAALADLELSEARRVALGMAVLTQLYVALAAYEEARTEHAAALRLADLDRDIARHLRSSRELRLVDAFPLILGELDALRSAIARDLAYAELESSFGRIFVAIGADAVARELSDPSLEVIARALAETEAAWRRGEVAMRPFGAAEAPAQE